MADWQRRAATSTKRRRTRRVPKIRWPDLLRIIAWPVGEQRELELWAEALAPLSSVLRCMAAVATLFWLLGEPPHVPTPPAEFGSVAAFLWTEFCGSTRPGKGCIAYNWLPPICIGCLLLLAEAARCMFGPVVHKDGVGPL